MAWVATVVGLSWRDRALLVEAALVLTWSTLCIALLPFNRVVGQAARSTPSEQVAPAPLARRIAWAIGVCARRAPWRTVCFQQGLAAHWMLRRRRLRTSLHYGARREDLGGLAAHVWVRSGDLDVIGCENAADYSLLSTFVA